MMEKLDRDQLTLLVERIQQSAGSDEEIESWLDLVDQNVPAPSGYVSDLIFWSDLPNGVTKPDAAEIVEKALSYKPICL